MAQKVVVYVFETVWFCLRAGFPEQNSILVPYGLCFSVSLRFSVPCPKPVKAVLEALKRYFNIVLDYFLGLEMRARGPGEHGLWHILLNPNQQQSAELKKDKKN